MAKEYIPERSRWWWLWPDFYAEKDAHDIIKMGLGFVVLSAAFNGGIYIYKYFASNDLSHLIVGCFVVIIYGVLGYGMFKMSRTAASIILLLVLADWVVAMAETGKVSAFPFLSGWSIFQANRGIYWFRGKKETEEELSPIIKKCPQCGEEYNQRDFNFEGTSWVCGKCKATLPRD